MAAEVPVCDVLCEAMEYLSKLGSNLRTRSENLREKKIRKDKLRNTHAVQKAANKVLLICELSKKSLENVETGVRKVLSLVDAAQVSTSVGGKTFHSKKENVSTPRFHYFKYRSHKLKITKRVALKHYTSVKVLAEKMNISMQENYPVYYDCKLYRSRKDKNNIHSGTKQSSTDIDTGQKNNDNGLHQENEDIIGDIHQKKNSENTIECLTDSLKCESQNTQPIENLDDSAISHSEISTKHMSRKKNQDIEGNSTEEIQNATDKTKKKKEKSESDSENNCSGKHKCQEKSKEPENISSKKDRRHSEGSKSKKDDKKKKFKHIRIIDSSESDDDTIKLKIKSNDDEGCVTTEQKSAERDTSNSSPSESISKKRKLNEPDMDITSKENHRVVSLDSDHEKNENVDMIPGSNEESNNQLKKPVIKCVNINTLLKPDILLKDKDITNISKKNIVKPTKKLNDRSTSENAISENEQEKSKCDDEYWAQKRKEVKAFKPKNLSINVIRLPKLSVNYLHIHNLKKIIHNDSVICEANDIENNSDKSGSTKTKIYKLKENCSEHQAKSVLVNTLNSDVDSRSLNKNLTVEAKKVRDALLNESDSDHTENCADDQSPDSVKRDPTTNVCSKKLTDKDSHLEKSVSHHRNQTSVETDLEPNFTNGTDNLYSHINELESDDQVNSMTAATKNIKDSLLYESDSEHQRTNSLDNNSRQNVEPNRLTIENENVKDTLLNDSDSDHQANPAEHNPSSPKHSRTSTRKSRLLYEEDLDSNSKRVNNSNQISLGNEGQNSNVNNNMENNDDIAKQSELTSDAQPESKERRNEISDNKLSPSKNPDKIKSSLLNDSSDDIPKTPLSQRKKRKLSVTPQSKRKYIMESMHAKKMLLTYSSSSDTDDEQLRNALKEIKKDLLKSISDEEDELKEQIQETNSQDSNSSPSSAEDIIKHVTKNMSRESQLNLPQTKKKSKKTRKKGIDGNMDDKSNSSSSKMVRSRAKPGGSSSSQNSDAQDPNDKDIDGLTNLKTLNKTRRRRDSTSTHKTENSVSETKDDATKESVLIGEELLKAESSSDVASEQEIEGDELPAVSISGQNGDSITHFVKDDLLRDSDSSVSCDTFVVDNNSEKVKGDDSDEKETVKLKRRKPNAISSDSEVGSSRKKDKDVRMSDFEDSEDDSSESAKKNKRQKKGSDSDASAGSSSNDASKKKRRRIKQVDESDKSGSDTENEGKNKHGRKNIRKVMGKNQLEEATKKAAREEKERIARITERQKLYNNLEFDESGKPDEVVLEKVVLDFDPETKEPLIEVDRGLVKKLKPHQANGIKFMWNACFESVKRIKKDKGSGCILAHCMGLGKTLQVVSLTHTLLTHSSLTRVNRVLVVCPLSTVLNWVNEFHMWLKYSETDFEVDVYELSRYKQNSERAFQLAQWFERGGVCVLGYEMFRNLSADNNKKFKKKMLRHFQESLVDPGPDLVVCDEGHLLKNEKTSLSQSMNRVKTLRRIVLTGTPLQNNLKEYYCMVQFVKPNLLGKYNEYLNRFVNPITNGQYTDSTEHDIRVMKRRSHVLHKMLDGAVQRRDYGVLAPFLPPKHEYVLFITLTEVQTKLYQYYLDNYSRRPLAGKSSGFLFPDFQSLQRIWTHPLVLKYNSERYEIMQQKKREREEEDSEGSLADFIDDDSTPDETSTEESSDDSSDMSDDSRKKSKKKKSGKKSKGKEGKASTRRGTRANPVELDDEARGDDDVVEVKSENPTEWWVRLVSEPELEDLRHSHKLVLLFAILRECDTIGDKLLVFSQSLYSLDLIEHFLGKVDEATQEGRIDDKLGGHVGSWSPGVDYFRLDGSTSCENRSIWCKNFNREDNPRARLFLISTRAGGLGINLVAANRVVIFDVSWNPSHDVQSIFRVYRFGQKKPCYVYRFLAMGTMEEKIYERQVTKQAISKRVIDEQQIDRHYAENDLAELYKFEPRPPAPRPLPPLPRDRLFAEMLREHEAQIYKYHEHDSLLENKEEETLSEEERKAAWEDFENEKNKPPPAPFPSPWPMHNGMMPNLLAQQQQQLAYAALAAMLRKNMPNINDNQIQDMLPLVYNSNPAMFGGYDYGLMQKMSEIYKYAQPGMLNQGMMNSLNAAGGGMGGTSGLQYEPPWHRQQQQMRLQQLAQHQNQMGQKLYAGGLGSRDPVAMALQQQRAREIMYRGGGAQPEGAARPRGRPPLQPRAPPAPAPPAASDVVNLDSD